MNREIPDVQAEFRKGRKMRDQAANIHWIIETARRFQKNIYFCFPGGSDGKESACSVGDLASIPGSGRSPGEGVHSSILAWKIPWMEEPGSLQSMGSQTKSWTRLSDFTFTASVVTLKLLTGQIITNCGKFLQMGMPDHLTCLLRNLYAGQEATVRTGHGTTDWFQIGKGVRQGCILSPCLFNLYAEYIM